MSQLKYIYTLISQYRKVETVPLSTQYNVDITNNYLSVLHLQNVCIIYLYELMIISNTVTDNKCIGSPASAPLQNVYTSFLMSEWHSLHYTYSYHSLNDFCT